jgi:hypothetical protein
MGNNSDISPHTTSESWKTQTIQVATAVTGGFAFSTTFTGAGIVTTGNDIRE